MAHLVQKPRDLGLPIGEMLRERGASSQATQRKWLDLLGDCASVQAKLCPIWPR